MYTMQRAAKVAHLKQGGSRVEGWVSLHRKVRLSAVWQDAELFRLWCLCLLKATHKPHKQMIGNQYINLEPGQFVTGRDALAEEYNRDLSPSKRVKPLTLWRWIQKLEKLENLNIKSTNKYSVITVVNWSEYQETEQQMNNKRTTNEQQMITNNNGNNTNKKDIDQPSGKSKVSYPDDFEKFWSIYPRKVGKPKAFSCWKARVKKVSKDDLLKAAQNYAKHCEIEGTIQKFIKHPSTFLGSNLDYQDWTNYQPEQPKSNVVPFEDKREKARNESMEQQIAVSKWIQVTGRGPDEHFDKWYKGGAKLDELERYAH